MDMLSSRTAIPRALTIASSDSGGEIGIQADLKTFADLDVYGLSVCTAIIAQNTESVLLVQDVSPALIEAQIDTVLNNIGTDATKVSVLSSSVIIKVVASQVRKWKLRLVIDPITQTKDGDLLLQPDAIASLLSDLLPLAEVATLNLHEAEVLTGQRIKTFDEMRSAARIIHDLGPHHVVIKERSQTIAPVDVYFNGEHFVDLWIERAQIPYTRHSSSTFSAAITALMARGCPVDEAIIGAKRYMQELGGSAAK